MDRHRDRSNSRDEHYTLHTKLLEDLSIIDRTGLEKCIPNLDKIDQSICSLDDFTSVSIYDDQSFHALQSKQTSCKNSNRAITSTPADSSGGFHNTMSILDHHLNKKKHSNRSQDHKKYLMLEKKDDGIPHRKCSRMTFNNNKEFPSVEHNTNDFKNDSHIYATTISRPYEEESLHSVWDKTMPPNNFESPSKQTEDNIPNSKIIYHIARSPSGQLYLRVRRSLHLDQGIFYGYVKYKYGT